MPAVLSTMYPSRGMHDIEWRWADPSGQQRRIRLDELRAALAGGVVAPNAPVWRAGWPQWRAARDVPELQSSALSAENGLLPNIPPPPLAVVAAQSAFEAQSGPSHSAAHEEPPPPPHYVPLAPLASSPVHGVLPSSPVSAPPTTVPLPPGSGPKLVADPRGPASTPKVDSSPKPVESAPVRAPASKPEPSQKPPEVAAAVAPALAPVPRLVPEKVTAPPRASTQIGMPAVIPKDRPSQKVTQPEIASPAPVSQTPATPNGAADAVPPEELSWASLELADDVIEAKKAPPLPAEARRPSGFSPAVGGAMRGSTPPPPHARPSVPPALIAAGLTRPSSPPAGPSLAEEMSSSALVVDDSSSYSYVSPRSSKAPSMPPKAPSMPPKAPSMAPARPAPVPSRPPPPFVPAEELSSSLLEADASGAFPHDAPRLAAMLRNNAPVEELSSSMLTSADSTSAIPIVPAAAVVAAATAAPVLFTPAASPALAAALPTPPPPANGAASPEAASIATSLFGSPSPLLAPPAAAPAAPAPTPAPAPAEPSLFGPKHTPTSFDAVAAPGPVAPPEAPQASVSVPTSLFGTPSPLTAPLAPASPPRETEEGSAPPVVKDTKAAPAVQGIGAPPPSSNGPPSSGISVPTSMGIGLPSGEVASHPVVVPPPANRPTSDAAAYFERADKDEVRPPSAPEPEAQEDMLEGLVAPSPLARAKKALGPLLARFKVLAEEDNRFFLPGIVAASTVFTFVFMGVVYAASSDGTPPATTVASSSAHPSSEAPSHALPSAAPPKEVASAAAPPSTPPPPPPAAGVSCKLSGEPVPVAEKTSIAAGIEVLAQDGMTAVGYASSPKEGQLVRLGEGLAPTPAGRLKMGEPIRRVQPLIHKGKLEMAVEIDKKILGMSSRRSVVHDPPFDIGIAGATLGHALHLRNGEKELFAVPGEGPIEALRVAPTSATEKGVAVAFRHGGAIYVGVATGEELAPKGELQKASGTGEKVGSPAIAVSDDTWLSVFADRTGEAPWGLRMFGAKVGATAFASKAFALPKGGPGGGVISPSLVSLGSGMFLLTWTEGPDKGHQVRAQVLDSSGEPSGEPFAVSPAGTDAGQARGAVDASGKGVLAYFAAKEEGYRLVAVPLSCGK